MWIPERIALKNFCSHADSEYKFIKGKAVMILGQNLDDSGQKSNGSGKSGLIDGIAYAVTGLPFRDVNASELVKNEPVKEKFAEVYFALYNPETESVLEITRKVYSGSKSAELSILLNGKIPQAVPTSTSGEFNLDVKEGNKWLMNKIGITREDLTDYFIITKDNYTSFFKASDTKKKEIINRFSGGQLVDPVFAEIEADVYRVDKQIKEVENQKQRLEGRLETYKEELLAIENADSFDVEKTRTIDTLTEKIHAAGEDIDALTYQSQNLDDDSRTHEAEEKEAQKLVEETQGQIRAIQDRIETQENLLADFTVRVNLKHTEISTERKNAASARKTVENELKEKRGALAEVQGIVADLNKQILGAVECPKCTHEFLLTDKKASVEDLRAELEEATDIESDFNTEIMGLQSKLSTIDSALTEKIRSIQAEIKALELKQEPIKEKIRATNEELTKQKAHKRNLEGIVAAHETNKNNAAKASLRKQSEIEEIKLKIEGYKARIEAEKNKQYEDKRPQVKEKIKATEDEIQKTLQALFDLATERSAIEVWSHHFTKFKSFLANKSISTIAGLTNYNLENMDSNLTVKIEGFKPLSNKKISEKINTTVIRDGEEVGSFGYFSGGEKVRINLALIIALRQLINFSAGSNGLDLLITDEIFESMDDEGVSLTMKALNKIGQTTLNVTHSATESDYEHKVLITKKDRTSTIQVI